jgi:hypothetical protein
VYHHAVRLLTERVTPTLPSSGRVALAAIVGGLWGWFALRHMEMVPTWLNRGVLGIPGNWGWIGIVALPVLIWLLIYMQVEQRWRPVLLVGSVLTFAGAVAVRLRFQLEQPALGIDSPWWMSVRSLLVPAIVAFTGPVFALAALGFTRLVVRKVIPQTTPARLCWGCGYDLGPVVSATCPECGKEFTSVCERPLWVWRLVATAQRAARPVLVLMLVVLGGLVLHRLVTEVVPARAFLQRFGDELRFDGTLRRHVPGMTFAPSRLPIGRSLSRVVWPSESDVAFLVILTLDSPPTMQVWAVGAMGPGDARWDDTPVFIGMAAPVASLTSSQAACVLRDGLPPPMIRAMGDRANTIEYADRPPERSIGFKEPFDPAPFFPPEP